MGRSLEDFRVGEVIKHWPGRTIRDFDDTWFTLLTMNTNPLHLDEHFASQSQHGRCLVNGTLVFALTVGMSVRDIGENALANLEVREDRPPRAHLPRGHDSTPSRRSWMGDAGRRGASVDDGRDGGRVA